MGNLGDDGGLTLAAETQWQSQPANWMNTRWVGALEEIDGRCHMKQMQMQFAFAQGV